MKNTFIISMALLSMAPGLLHAATATIHNAEPRRDVQGHILDAHDGCLEYFEGRFYLYGTRYGKSDGFGKTNRYVCYSSSDLTAWTAHGEVLKDAPPRVYYRPYIKFNQRSGKYVMWYNADGQYGVAVSDTPEGPFSIHDPNVRMKHDRGGGMGDFGLFVDDDGAGYIAYSSSLAGVKWSARTEPIMHHQICVEKLAPDYLASTQEATDFIAGNCEAPALFKRNGIYYLLFDNTSCFGVDGSGARVYTASKPLGPFTYRGNINIKADRVRDLPSPWTPPGSGRPDCVIKAQQTHVATLPTPAGVVYLWMGDRWGSRPDGIKGHDLQYWSSPLHFDSDGMIQQLRWEDQWEFELPVAFRASSPFLDVTLSHRQPALKSLAVDSLGLGRCEVNSLHPPAASTVAFKVHAGNGPAARLEYRRPHTPDDTAPGWTLEAAERAIRLVSQYSAGEKPDPLVCDFDTARCHTTLLGLLQRDGGVSLPAILHLPGHGTLRVTGSGSLGYASGNGFVKVTFPAATAAKPRVEYHLEVAAICPPVAGIDNDPRFNGFRRNWLNVLQLNPARRVLSNNAASDTCGFCYYEYADIALYTPPLAGNLAALDVMRQTLEQVLAGTKTYGMPGYGDFPEVSADTYPSLIIAAYDCTRGGKDQQWLEKNYAGIRQWTDKMLATDRQGNGLIKYDSVTGNSGSWNEGQPKKRPANWWDTIGFGHEDAYANALAYRALRSMEGMAGALRKPGDAARYRTAAEKLRAAYFDAFYNPATGVLAGWRSADGQLHDYHFLFVNGIAIHYGLVPEDKANAIMDRLLAKMRAVGYTRFDLGLPGNLVSVARKDYAHRDPRFGGGRREDNADGFQIYENGGATGCFAYFTLAALYDLGRREEADRMLMPMLEAFEHGRFEGTGANGMSNDWRAWDGAAWGYEGFLVDNYYVLLAVLARDKAAQARGASTEIGP
jgi:hypothetical protein